MQTTEVEKERVLEWKGTSHRICMGLLVLLIVVLLCACQPTPETAPVVNGSLQDAIARSSASIATYNAPERWQETPDMNGSETEVQIDAVIDIPDVTAFPVYKVMQTTFEDESIQPLLNYFVQGRNVILMTAPIKDEIEIHLVAAKKNGDQDLVETLEEMIQSAPESVNTEYVTDFSLQNNQSQVQGYIALENGTYAGIDVNKNMFSYGNGIVETDYILSSNGEVPIGTLRISEEDAAASAWRLLDELGVIDMAISSVEKGRILPYTSTNLLYDISEEKQSKGYLISFVCSINGIPTEVLGSSSYDQTEFEYSAPFYQEEIRVFVDEQGEVQSFGWFWPLTITETVSRNTSLLPFEKMEQRIQSMLLYQYAYNTMPSGNDYKATLEVEVDRIEMRMALISEKDSQTKRSTCRHGIFIALRNIPCMTPPIRIIP